MAKFLDADGVRAVKGIYTEQAVNNVNDTTPTLAEITTSFGAPTTRGAGFIGVINDAAGGTNFYLIGSDGTNYFHTKMVKAV